MTLTSNSDDTPTPLPGLPNLPDLPDLDTEAHPIPAMKVIGRALRLRCPVCGKGAIFQGITTRNHCPVCGFVYEREEGYFTNGIVLNYMIACTVLAIIVTPLALIVRWPIVTTILVAVGLALLLTALVFLHAKSLWLAFDLVARPPTAVEFVPVTPTP